MPVTKRTFNLIFEFDENFSDDEIHRTIAKILHMEGIKSMSWDYPNKIKNKILNSIIEHLQTLHDKEI